MHKCTDPKNIHFYQFATFDKKIGLYFLDNITFAEQYISTVKHIFYFHANVTFYCNSVTTTTSVVPLTWNELTKQYTVVMGSECTVLLNRSTCPST